MASNELLEGRAQALARRLEALLEALEETTGAALGGVEYVGWEATGTVEWLQDHVFRIQGLADTASDLLLELRRVRVLPQDDDAD